MKLTALHCAWIFPCKACWTQTHSSLCMIHVLIWITIRHFQHFLYGCDAVCPEITAMWGLTTAFTQALYHYTDLSRTHLCDGVLSIFYRYENNSFHPEQHQMCCFSSMRYNQTINSLRYLSSYPPVIRCAPLTPGSPAHTRWSALLRSQACFPATYSLMISWERFCASSVRPAVLLNQCTAARSNLLQEAGPSRAYSFTHWLAERDVFAHWSVHTSISCMRWARPESTRGTVEYR